MALGHTSGTTSLIPGYTITEEVYRDRRRIMYRGSRDRDGIPVIIETLLERSGDTGTLGREYDLIQSLDLDGVPRAIDLVRTNDRVALVLEDDGRRRLKTLIPAGGWISTAFSGSGSSSAKSSKACTTAGSFTRTSVPTAS